jgi:hypothetical protein
MSAGKGSIAPYLFMKASQKEREQIVSLEVSWPYIGWKEDEC